MDYLFVFLVRSDPHLASLSRKNEHAGIRNSPVQGAYSNNPINEFALSLGPRLSLFSGTCQSIKKVGGRRFVEGLYQALFSFRLDRRNVIYRSKRK